MFNFFSILYYHFACFLVRCVSWLYFPYTVVGAENVPRDGGCVLASNHISNLDPVVVAVTAPRRIKFVAKESLFKNPILGSVIRAGGGYPIKRDSADVGALKETVRRIQSGFPVLIFPQGTRGGKRAKAGIGFLCQKASVPVVPVYVSGTDEALPRGGSFLKRHPVQVKFGPPVIFPSDEKDYQKVADTIMDAINQLESN